MEAQQDKLVITYPPTFDGELHVNAKRQGQMYNFDFNYTTTGFSSSWDALVQAAQDILESNQRRKDEAILSKSMEQLFFDTFNINFNRLRLCDRQVADMGVRYSWGCDTYKYTPTMTGPDGKKFPHSWTMDPDYPF